MQQPVLRVGEWLVTPSVNQISRDGHQITLEPRLIDLLVFFARHPDVVLSRDELIDNVWTRNVVTSHVVTQSISELRKSLKNGNDASFEYIVTVPKRGYKLAAKVIWYDEETPGEVAVPAVQARVVSPAPAPLLAADEKNELPIPIDPETLAAVDPGIKRLAMRQIRRSRFWVWFLFAAALCACVVMIGLATHSMRKPVTSTRMLLNPRDIDIRLEEGNSCSSWTTQRAYVVGLSGLITNSLNTFSTYMVHDKTDFNYTEPSSSGKTLTIQFVNQRHYRAQQCFMSVRMIDNADRSVMLDKRYFITSDNLLTIQNDLLNSLSESLKQPWPERMQTILSQTLPGQSASLQRFYQAHQLLIDGNIESLNKASAMLQDIITTWPDFNYDRAEKALVDVLSHSEQPLEKNQLAALYQDINRVAAMPGMQDSAIFYQIKTIDLLGQGKFDEAEVTIDKAIDQEMSWINYVLLGKVYEMKGDNRLAADAYITAFNLRPGENTLHWITNSVFQTSVNNVVPYLDNFTGE